MLYWEESEKILKIKDEAKRPKIPEIKINTINLIEF